MELYNVGSLINGPLLQSIAESDSVEELASGLITIKTMLVETYQFRAINLPVDFKSTSYIIALNHQSDMDGPLMISYYYQIMHSLANPNPKLLTFAKKECFVEEKPARILNFEMVVSIDRQHDNGGLYAMRQAMKWYKEGDKPKHFLIFPQGTIFDIDKDEIDDIQDGAFRLAAILKIPVLPGYIEFPKEGEENRVIFAAPMHIADGKDSDGNKTAWKHAVIAAQNDLINQDGRGPRTPVFGSNHLVRKRFH